MAFAFELFVNRIKVFSYRCTTKKGQNMMTTIKSYPQGVDKKHNILLFRLI
jgi:hypothetical protein